MLKGQFTTERKKWMINIGAFLVFVFAVYLTFPNIFSGAAGVIQGGIANIAGNGALNTLDEKIVFELDRGKYAEYGSVTIQRFKEFYIIGKATSKTEKQNLNSSISISWLGRDQLTNEMQKIAPLKLWEIKSYQ